MPWQRDEMVVRTFSGACVIKMNCVISGGSSMLLSKRLAVSLFIFSGR